MSSGNDEDSNAVPRILGNRRQEQHIRPHHFFSPFLFLVTESITHTLAPNNGIKTSQTRELNRIGEWEPPHHSTEVPAHSSLEAMNSEESWAFHHPHTVTPAHRAQGKTLRLGLIFFYLCIYIFIISPTNLDFEQFIDIVTQFPGLEQILVAHIATLAWRPWRKEPKKEYYWRELMDDGSFSALQKVFSWPQVLTISRPHSQPHDCLSSRVHWHLYDHWESCLKLYMPQGFVYNPPWAKLEAPRRMHSQLPAPGNSRQGQGLPHPHLLGPNERKGKGSDIKSCRKEQSGWIVRRGRGSQATNGPRPLHLEVSLVLISLTDPSADLTLLGILLESWFCLSRFRVGPQIQPS